MSYQVGVDLGTTYSAAAVSRPGGAVELVPLGQRSRSVPSTVYASPDGGFLIGEAAERHALSDPGRVVREFKRRIGDPTPVLVGHEPMPAEELAARFISRLLQDVAGREGSVAARVAVTHPAGWGPHKLESLRGALTRHGLGSAVLLSEPQAAAVGYANTERVEPGATIAVYDLGGGTFDAAVVRKTAAGGFELLGTPEGLEQLGGVDFDEAVFTHVREALGAEWAALDPFDPEVLAAVAGLRRECTAAKEALSHDTEVLVPVLLPGICTQVRLGRAEFEEMIRPAVAETVAALRRALSSAGVTAAELTTLLLVGGSSRIPLITQEVSAEFGRSAGVDVDPKGVIAAGAAVVARGRVPAPSAEGSPGGQHPSGSAATGPVGQSRPAGPGARAGVVAAVLSARAAGPVEGAAVAPVRLPSDGPAAGVTRVADPGSLGPAPRPPKQARPFTAEADPPDGRRRIGIGLAAGALILVLLGGAVAFAAGKIGANREADASTPPTTATAVSPVATAGVPLESPPPGLSTPAPDPAPPPARPRTRAPGPRNAPAPVPVTTAPAPGANGQPAPGAPGTVPPDNGADNAGQGGGQDDAAQDDGAQDNGAQDDGAQDNGAQDNGGQNDGAQDDGAQDDGAQNDGAQNDGGQDNGAELGANDTGNGAGQPGSGQPQDRAGNPASESAGAAGPPVTDGAGAANVLPVGGAGSGSTQTAAAPGSR